MTQGGPPASGAAGGGEAVTENRADALTAEKVCSRCNKPGEFYAGRGTVCKACKSARIAAYRRGKRAEAREAAEREREPIRRAEEEDRMRKAALAQAARALKARREAVMLSPELLCELANVDLTAYRRHEKAMEALGDKAMERIDRALSNAEAVWAGIEETTAGAQRKVTPAR